MRIAVWYNMPSGGGLRVLDDQVRGLVSLGHEVHVWSPPMAASFGAQDLAASVHTIALDQPSQHSHWTQLRSAWRGHRTDIDAYEEHHRACAREMSAVGADIVLAHSCMLYRVPALAASTSPTPALLYLHEPNRALFEAMFDPPWPANPPNRTRVRLSSARAFVFDVVGVEQPRIQLRCENAWIRAFDEVLVNSRFSREAVLRAYGTPSRVCAPGIDLGRFAFQHRPEQVRGHVLFVGALVLEKNPEFLVRAIAAAGPTVKRFVWVANYANPQWRERVEQLAADLDVPLEVRCEVTDDELVRSYAEADVFVYAPRLEPLGLAPLEANATGLPVVAVAEGGVRETVVDGVNGVLVEPDPALVGVAVSELLADSERARALGRSGREHVVAHWSLAPSIAALDGRLRDLARRDA